MSKTHLRIAAMGDLHVSRHSQGAFHELFRQIGEYPRNRLCRHHPFRYDFSRSLNNLLARNRPTFV